MLTVTACRACAVPLRPGRTPDVPGTREHWGRGLCLPCGDRAHRAGRLAEFPAINRRLPDVLDDLAIWARRRPDASLRELAELMGMTYAALDRARWRARARGIPVPR